MYIYYCFTGRKLFLECPHINISSIGRKGSREGKVVNIRLLSPQGSKISTFTFTGFS